MDNTVKHIADTIDAREYEHLEHDKNGNIYFFPKNGNIDIIKYDGKIYSSIKISQPDTCAFAAISKCFAATINGKMVIAYSTATSFRVNYHDYVCNETARGIMKLNTTYDTPIIFGILTCNTEEQLIERMGHGFAVSGLNLLTEVKKI